MNEQTKCFIWSDSAAFGGGCDNRDIHYIDSPRAGGRYKISDGACINLQNTNDFLIV